MADVFKGRKILIESEFERRIRMRLDRAFVYQWKARDIGRILVLENRFVINELFDLLMREGDEGYAVFASQFARRAADIERPVRARFLTLLARMLHDGDAYGRREVEERQVAHFARFVNVLLARKGRDGRDDRMDGLVLAWVEDMNVSDPENDLEPQPTAVIRGVLFSPSFDHRQAFGFWERAARSAHFPDRIFSDPCPAGEGRVFTAYHLRAFGLFFSAAPEDAVKRFASHMREHAVTVMSHEWIADAGKWVDKAVPATDRDRDRVFDGILGYVEGEKRKEKVRSILQAA